jgi:HK97 family phage major capsid protein
VLRVWAAEAQGHDGQYLWQPSTQAGQPATLLGYPVTEMAAMPTVAANALAVAFGDFREGYLIVDRIGVRVLRDPYTNKPYVMFYTTKRVGGGLLNPDAIKVLKIAGRS